ncbi:hypothetical protein D3C73_1351640 [compost metagenome]
MSLFFDFLRIVINNLYEEVYCDNDKGKCIANIKDLPQFGHMLGNRNNCGEEIE